jgi:GT2 family glycosyltransferase
MQRTDLAISIVTYNSKNVLKDCIDSIIRTIRGMTYEIIVVDNCSEDGTAALVKEFYPSINLIENRDNVGFGRAHNQSFKVSSGRYFLILNPDTIVFPEAVNKMVNFMDSNDRAGVVGCKTYWDDDKNFMFPDLRIHSLTTALFQFTPFCRFFPNSALSKWYWESAYRLWNAKRPIKIEGITGGLMLVRREAFESAGMFDENFFLFFEEHDLLKRIKKAGWDIYYYPDAEIQHYFEESCRRCSFDIGKVFMQSSLHYYKKHYAILGFLLIKSLLAFSRFLLFAGPKFFNKRLRYEEIGPDNGMINIEWPPAEKAAGYVVEISYSPAFSDRGGMFVDRETLSLKSNILNRLPNNTGFLRVLPVRKDGSIGKVIKTLQITSSFKH